LVLDEVFEQVSREYKSYECTQIRSYEDYWDRKEETIEFGLKDLGISVAEHDDRVRDGQREDYTEAQQVNRVAD